mmetsp:Transcript_16527/g.47572  ORF Transcript_16527/g.47572 Transcript_16527/m.47572 type:complete len:440 (-) Transcript_16527:255-1574(-)|eukprot:CAMPEP_0113542652 /NCGR_PEP_ID=MMETSP0015_2-20120614/9728_1 /TAXON_ID=2838 /ORGANISM="Odontella" /LENGTH=439 /DNA_ID=CAMNT_0000442737 /DNA_START=74 /DNA_END=1393 /DNA_ORIENTATION=+ /assembly_acc=CAM_ASM_000160
MSDQQQEQPKQRLADVETGLNEVCLENEGVRFVSSSPLYSRRDAAQQSNASLSSAGSERMVKRVSTSSTNTCSTLGNVGTSARASSCFEESEDELEMYDYDVPPPALPVRRTFSAVSGITNKYDLTGKGYLDDTEKAMRALDTENRGALGMNEVYLVMKEMQQQQTALHEQQKSFANLKKVVIVLSCFSMVLALANLGTAFAAATLAKDTKVDAVSGALLAKGSGESISTVSTGGVIHVEEMTEVENAYERRRNLRRVARRASVSSFGGGRGFGFADQAEELICPGPAIGMVDAREVRKLRGDIEVNTQYVTFKYKLIDQETKATTKSSLSLHIMGSDDDGTNMHIHCTRAFKCSGRKCEDENMWGQYRLAPETFSFQPTENGEKYGLYSCLTSAAIDITGGGNLDLDVKGAGNLDGGVIATSEGLGIGNNDSEDGTRP